MDGYNVWVGYNFHLTMRVAIAMDQMYTTKWSIKALILMKKLWVELFRKTHAKIFLPHCKMIKAHNILFQVLKYQMCNPWSIQSDRKVSQSRVQFRDWIQDA